MASAELAQAIYTMAAADGYQIPRDIRTLLERPEGSLSQSEVSRINVETIYLALWRGFFHLAARGQPFTSLDRIRERFGATLEQNYPEASRSFISVARSYWTFKVVFSDYTTSPSTIDQLARRLEMDIASVFFPTPGPVMISPAEREQKQRELLAQFAPDIDVEDFVRGNPILIRDKTRTSGGGCLGSVLVGFLAVATGLFLVLK